MTLVAFILILAVIVSCAAIAFTTVAWTRRWHSRINERDAVIVELRRRLAYYEESPAAQVLTYRTVTIGRNPITGALLDERRPNRR